ncbi:MAG TPA: TetR/AcrR family transcriptional regulator C-terminal domain-containing protein [Candidatus Salinicoccus stercoripullorum]|uniref:TetR/AcrR family transcriptional regulator C-terminal domain-containing protein n=1 Tax=Candidatus Salinicoccus stercoripullorum TaxID=2838756 RepID=A0A9D1TZ30_9STAP|nr:TetR/AcrR family transcriptional regulator C-terminal domain-containing protein [Candidatus Salinicoccus stercoripullorum]
MKKDLRVQKTLHAIDQAIIALLQKKPFENITIQDISNEAMINRGTFYSYYKDKYELIESYQESMMTDIEQLLYKNITGSSFKDVDEQHLQETILQMFQYLKDNRTRVLVIANSLGPATLAKYFSQHMFNFYKVKSREFGVELDSEIFTDYLITYITNAHIGIFLKWLKGGCEESIEEMAMFIETFTINGVFKTVGI